MTQKQSRPAGTGRLTTTTTTAASITGCPCGCGTRLPWLDDTCCVRHLPMPRQREQVRYDVVDLGLVEHDRDRCGACRAVGA